MNKPEPAVGADTIFSVSDASALLKNVVETAFSRIKIRGELSQITRASSGHIYMTIKDNGAAINAIIWRGTLLPFNLDDGIEVIATGKFTTYPARSNYQIIVSSLEMAGAGAILKMLEERKQKLAALGLFDASRKKPLPRFPQTIGIVTSPTGAAFQDIINKLRDRLPVRVLLYPTMVQGTTAATEVARGIEYFNSLVKSSPPVEECGNAAGWFSQARNSQRYYNLPFNPDLTERAKENRKSGSLPEALFWNQLKNKQLLGLDFDRQKIIGNYIVDFFCASIGLVIEIDDKAIHEWKENYDEKRDEYLKSLDLEVIHISAESVLKNPADAAKYLENKIQTWLNHPAALPHPSTGGELSRPDVIIVARGGGSLEDLLPFSEEVVVRAVADSEIPVVSGIGHEPDWMLIDFAADVRAPTPTGAAEIVVPTKISLINELENIWHRIHSGFTGKLGAMRDKLNAINPKSPRQVIMERAQRLDDISRTLNILYTNKIATARVGLRVADNMEKTIKNHFATLNQNLNHFGQMLGSLSYKSVLNRGFAMVRGGDKIISRAADFVRPATIEFADGVIEI